MSKRVVREGELAHERAEQVVRLEPDDARDTRRPVPVLDRPAPRRGDDGERGVGIDGVRGADAREQRHVEDAVTAGVAVGQVDALVFAPLAHGAQLARPPDESLVEAAGVAAVLGLVGRGDQVVEAEGLGKGGDHVDRRRGGQHEAVALGPEGGQALGGEGGDQLAQGGDRPPAGGLHLVLAPAPGHPGRCPHQAHGEQVLPQAVVDGVEQPVAGERPPLGHHSLLHQGPVQSLARRAAQQGAVEVDEDGALRHGYEA